MEIILFSNDCPRCRVLEKKMMQKGINFSVNKNAQDLLEVARAHGIQSAPILKVDQQLLEFSAANQFINTL